MTKPTEQEVAGAIELQRPIEQPLAAPTVNIGDIISRAVESGKTGAELKELLDLAERMEAIKAEREFNAAFSRFKAECPPVPRRCENVQFQVTRQGVKRASRYASLEDMIEHVRPYLERNGLSYNWSGEMVVENDMATLTLTVRHIGGHKETTTRTLPIESRAGSSPQQKHFAIDSYLKRLTLSDGLGLATTDDWDGDAGKEAEMEIGDEQEEALRNMLATPGLPDDTQAKMLAWLGVESLADIPDARFRQVYAMLLKKIAAIPKPTEPDEPGPDATPEEYVDHILPEDMPPADEDPQQPDRESAVYKSLLADVRKRFKAMRDDARTAWLKDIGCKATEIGSLDYNELLSAREAMP